MDLWQLNIFCKVIELKSFSKAGKAILLSQPTVSSHIKDLEDHFGCRLIDRLSKEAVPTKAGKLLYTYASRLIALRDETETALSEFQGIIKGRLTVGGSTIPGGYILPQIIGVFTKDYPEAKISLVIADTENIINDILSGTLEMGIVGAQTSDKNITQEKLIEDEMCLVVPAEHPWAKKNQITLKQLVKEPFIAREHGSGTLKSIKHSLIRKGYNLNDLNIISEMGSTEAVKQGIRNNVGVSILSRIAVAEAIQAGSLTALSVVGLDLKRSFYLTRHKYRSEAPLCKAFIEFLTKELVNLRK